MSQFKKRYVKTASDGSELFIVLDGHHGWFLERPTDREAKRNPLGAFRTEEATRNWAERHFPGGDWRAV